MDGYGVSSLTVVDGIETVGHLLLRYGGVACYDVGFLGVNLLVEGIWAGI